MQGRRSLLQSDSHVIIRQGLWTLLFFAVLAAGCASASGVPTANNAALSAPTPTPAAIVAAMNVWTWVDFPDSDCGNGTPTGIGVNPGSGPDLMIYFEGGGVCWNDQTCFVLKDADNFTTGFNQASFVAQQPRFAGSPLDRTLPGSPFATATFVYIPYCTGDFHSGQNVASLSATAQFVGRTNVAAYLRRIVATWPSPRNLYVVGTSAGGMGALFNYDALRQTYRLKTAYLIDDSGTPLIAASPFSAAIFSNWNLGALLDPLCSCRAPNGFSGVLAAMIQKYPNDRIGFISYVQDTSWPAFYSLTTPGFVTALNALQANIIAPNTNARSFLYSSGGPGHVVFFNPGSTQSGTSYLKWITQEVTGDPNWTNVQ